MAQRINDTYDIVIIGAGPAGLNACLHAFSRGAGLSVLLVDKLVPWQKPKACAEGVGRLGFSATVSVKQEWIRHDIGKAAFHAPDGAMITYTDRNKGYIIDRSAMQRDMASQCEERGAGLLLNTRVLRLGKMEKGFRALSLDNGAVVRARVVIDSSGPSSTLCRDEGIPWKAPDLEPAYFAHLAGLPHETDTVHIYVGKELAPGGYAWMFPSHDDTVNAGVLVGKAFRGRINIKSLLERLLAAHFPRARVLDHFAGCIPCSSLDSPSFTAGLLRAGDAANTVNPISRAGIVEAMISGGLAGDHAVEMLAAGSFREMQAVARRCEKAWNRRLGKRHRKLARVKGALASVPDSDYIGAARALAGIPRDKMTMAKIFGRSLRRFPRLVWALRHLM